ncbi:site-specific integrase [Methylomonas sp. EbB]|uniref:Site-specific integrase n=1 Tax=Methylomonas fluvii TaxID=1854564 RepID=A0ABR9DEP7_9GAMM|nr:site-specific integrase [Methylomonas fluvii]MBD9360788.1 site-specific integrase [Methylomonas fluvii]CAD6873651.1 Phage integrase [Methylomonas fluvii]
MSIYKRKDTWWIQFTAPDGTRIQRSAGTKLKQEAQELHDRLKADAWKTKRLGVKPIHTWQEAVIKWLIEQGHKRSIETDKFHLRWLDEILGNKTLNQIDKMMLERITEAKKAEGSSNATANRILSLVRAILNRAKNEWEWIDAVPNFRFLPEPNERIRWLTHVEASKLLIELPSHLEAMARFALATGLREANVTGLKWSQVDLRRECAWVDAAQAKANKPISVPLNTDAMAVLKSQQGQHNTFVFTFEGEPIKKAGGKAWKKALKRAEIEDFRWHDLRHTWASWHVQAGTPLNVLQELGGWASYDMVLRYAHLSSEHLKVHAGNSKLVVTKLLHFEKRAQ